MLWDLAATGMRCSGDLAPILKQQKNVKIHHNSKAPAKIDLEGGRDNILGISDMFGNVWEWCATVTRADFNRIPLIAVWRHEQSKFPQAQLRGGSFLDNLNHIEPSLLSLMLEDGWVTKHSDLGFRIAARIPVETLPADLKAALEVQKSFPESFWFDELDKHESMCEKDIDESNIHTKIGRDD